VSAPMRFKDATCIQERLTRYPLNWGVHAGQFVLELARPHLGAAFNSCRGLSPSDLTVATWNDAERRMGPASLFLPPGEHRIADAFFIKEALDIRVEHPVHLSSVDADAPRFRLVAIRKPPGRNCSIYGGWRDQLQARFRHLFQQS
jgi:hypothetical protein